MRILLIAHDFPPVESPQALRWHYLVRELARGGHEVDVLCAAAPGQAAGQWSPAERVSVEVIAPAGLYAWSLRALRRLRHAPFRGVPASAGSASEAAPRLLNWRGRLERHLKPVLAGARFPGASHGWLRPAADRLAARLQERRPDLVITSHEPAAAPMLWLIAGDPDIPWIADLGDPVLAPYTPRRWTRAARRVEEAICRRARIVTVTTQATADLLHSRHGAPASLFALLSQGFDSHLAAAAPADTPGEALRLLYAGRFYPFRTGHALFDAVAQVPGVVLDVATDAVPRRLRQYARNRPDAFRLLGGLPHEQALACQRDHDVLVCLGNADAVQIPGKVYEYLGARRPVLYLRQSAADPAGAWIERIGRGWQIDDRVDTIASRLRELRALRAAGTLSQGLDLGFDRVAGHSWQHHGSVLLELCERATALGRDWIDHPGRPQR